MVSYNCLSTYIDITSPSNSLRWHAKLYHLPCLIDTAYLTVVFNLSKLTFRLSLILDDLDCFVRVDLMYLAFQKLPLTELCIF